MRYAVNLDFGIRHNHLLLRGKPKRLSQSSFLTVVRTLPKKRAVCINYGVVQDRDRQHVANMESTFPAIFFATIIGVIVFIALSQVLLDPHE
jgi:hypothetical protein